MAFEIWYCNANSQHKTVAYIGGGSSPLAPPDRLRGAPIGDALLIIHLLAFSFLRPGTLAYLGGGAVVLLPPLGVPGGEVPRLEIQYLKETTFKK